VQWGQTLSGIAWYYGTTIQAIMYANPIITNPNLIYAGSTLCIP
jgi:LysM repeat protein